MIDNSKDCKNASAIRGRDELNLLGYWRVILKHKKIIITIVAGISIASVIISLILPKYYKAEAVIIPVSSKGGGGGLSALASQFGGLASLAGLSVPGGASETEKIVAVLNSRTLAENVINRENLMPVLFEKEWDEKTHRWKSTNPEKQPNMEMAVFKIRRAVNIKNNKKDRTIVIAGIFRSPEVAARVVNAYLDELQVFINNGAFTMAKRNRIFIERQLEENKKELLKAGKEINEFYTSKEISSAEAKIDVPVANFTDKEYQRQNVANSTIGLAQKDRTENHNLSNLLAKKYNIEKKIAEVRAVKNVPQQVYLSYLMLRRELLAKVNALLSTQYEMAKIEESKEELSFQVIDEAIPPEKRFSPRRKQICITAFVIALLGAIFIALFIEYINKIKQMPSNQS